MTTSTDDFYQNLPTIDQFQRLSEPESYHDMPDDWWVFCADIIDSTHIIQSGQYKAVNTVGAAVITAQLNALPQIKFPYAFGGDGAVFAVPASVVDTARDALNAVRSWAKDAFDIDLRAALVSASDVRNHGYSLGVARYRVSDNADYAMFHGGGISWVEDQMKAGKLSLPMPSHASPPDLTGLSCRWTPIEAQHGIILSLIIAPRRDASEEAMEQVHKHIIALSESLSREGHPIPEKGPAFRLSTDGIRIEVATAKSRLASLMRYVGPILTSLLALFLFRTNLSVAGFNPGHYLRTQTENADFRKFDDCLKMTLDCDQSTVSRIRDALDKAQIRGLLDYGMFEQSEALMTCIVPSLMQDDHMHFVDGAGGGYAMAAAQLKAQQKAFGSDQRILRAE